MSSNQGIESYDEDPTVGTPIGRDLRAESHDPVYIPANTRGRSVHIIGLAGVGKSTLMEAMILDEVRRGEGVLVLDPYGDMARRLLCLLPRDAIERVIYLGFNDPDWVPVWNPLHCDPHVRRIHLADGLVSALARGHTFFSCRIEHLLRQVFFGVLHLPEATLLDATNMIRRGPEGEHLRSRVFQAVNDNCAIHFWKHDFHMYTRDDLAPCQVLLNKLLMEESIKEMLSQPTSSFSLRQVMDDGMILVVDLSAVGPEIRRVLASIMLSLLHIAARGRTAASRGLLRQFHVYCDEGHQLIDGRLEDLLVEARRSGVDLVLAHQDMGQLSTRARDALSITGTTLSFRVSGRDAEYIAEELQGEVPASELTRLEVGQLIARIGHRIIRLEIFPPLAIPERDFHSEIIARSHDRYYLPSERIRRALR